MSIRNDTGESKKEPGSQKVLDHPARMVGGGRSIDSAKLSDLSERRDADLRQPWPFTAAEVGPCPAGLNKSFVLFLLLHRGIPWLWFGRHESGRFMSVLGYVGSLPEGARFIPVSVD